LSRLCQGLKEKRGSVDFDLPRVDASGKRIVQRMTSEQRAILISEFERNPDWSKQLIEHLAARLGFSKTKIY